MRHETGDRAVVVGWRLAEADAFHGHEVVATTDVHAHENCASLVHAPIRERALYDSHSLDIDGVREPELPADLLQIDR